MREGFSHVVVEVEVLPSEVVEQTHLERIRSYELRRRIGTLLLGYVEPLSEHLAGVVKIESLDEGVERR